MDFPTKIHKIIKSIKMNDPVLNPTKIESPESAIT